MIFAHGSRFGGHALFIKDQKLHYVYNFLGIKPEQEFVSEELDPGTQTLGMEFVREDAGEHGESIGTTTLCVDDQAVAKGPMRAQSASSPFPATDCASGLTAATTSASSTRTPAPSPVAPSSPSE